MSYWPALLWPSWNAFAKNESYGSVRNWIEIPVCCLNSGMIFFLNGVERAVLERADDELARRRRPRRAGPVRRPAVAPSRGTAASPAPAAAVPQQVAPAEPAVLRGRALGRHLGCHADISLRLLARSLRWSAVVPSGPKKHALCRVHAHADRRADRRREFAGGPRHHALVAERTSTSVSLPIGSTT